MKYSLAGKAPALKLTVTLVRTSDEPAVFTIPVRQAPSKVLLDPGNSVLAKR